MSDEALPFEESHHETTSLDGARLKKGRVHKCGWCLTGHHRSCKVETVYEGRSWRCQCRCVKR